MSRSWARSRGREEEQAEQGEPGSHGSSPVVVVDVRHGILIVGRRGGNRRGLDGRTERVQEFRAIPPCSMPAAAAGSPPAHEATFRVGPPGGGQPKTGRPRHRDERPLRGRALTPPGTPFAARRGRRGSSVPVGTATSGRTVGLHGATVPTTEGRRCRQVAITIPRRSGSPRSCRRLAPTNRQVRGGLYNRSGYPHPTRRRGS